MKERILMTSTTYSILKEKIKYNECGDAVPLQTCSSAAAALTLNEAMLPCMFVFHFSYHTTIYYIHSS
jgi:hypothetical protein